MKNKILLSLLLTAACAQSPKKVVNASQNNMALVESMAATYLELYPGDSDGFIGTDKCDSLIHTALANPNANLEAAENSPGEWYRRPVSYPECFKAKESRSTISRDGVLGVIYWALLNKKLDTLKRIWTYLGDHNGVLGEDGWEHAIATPRFLAILAEAIYYLSGKTTDYTIRQTLIPETTIAAPGYTQHLQAVTIIIVRIAKGDASWSNDVAVELARTNPDNPLFQIIAGDYAKATELIIKQFPASRLPTSTDWCADWILSEAPEGIGRKACPEEGRTHSGGELLFLNRLLH